LAARPMEAKSTYRINRSADAAVLPFQALDAALSSLSRGIRPVTLPGALLDDRAAGLRVPVNQVRARLTHPSCCPELRERIWSEVASRARKEGEPWTTIVVGLAVPGLRRILSRLPRLPRLPLADRAELEHETLTALLEELAQLDPDYDEVAGPLFKAADRVAHRWAYHHIERLRTTQITDRTSTLADTAYDHSPNRDADEYTLLWRAVQRQVIDPEGADLIARTRLEGVRVDDLAAERGLSPRTLFRQRAAAEDVLGRALRSRALRHPDE
jgi:hypothetical protein